MYSHHCHSMQAHSSQPKKISSLTLKAYGPEVTVCYPVKRNKCMSDLEKCWELNCIKALSLPELRTNWIKLEKQIPVCTNPFFRSQTHFLERRCSPCPVPFPSFVLVNISQMRFPKSGGERSMHAQVHRANITRQTHLSHQRTAWHLFPFLSLLKFHIEIPSCHSASLALSLIHQLATKSVTFNNNVHICMETHTRHKIQTFLKTTCPCSSPSCVG